MKDNAYLDKSRDYLSKGRIQDCISILKENINDEDLSIQILQLEIRNNTLKRRLNSGTIDISDAQIEENRISNSLVLLISNLAKGKKKEYISSIPQKKKFDIKWLIIGFLGLSLVGLGLYVFTGSNGDNTNIATASLCENVVCLNGGQCNNGNCDCPTGFTGDRCQTKIKIALQKDPCKNISCLNGGVCNNGNCDCPSGYTGKRCQTKIEPNDPCKSINCLNGGICRDGNCNCPSGYTGDRCQDKIPPEDPCSRVDCLNDGKCNEGHCKCPPGYSGNRCQIKFNPNELLDPRDNTKYRIKKIGNKYWTLDNMKLKITGSKCNDCSSKGRHYNFAMAKKVCPEGWTIPSVSDFKAINSAGGSFKGIARLADFRFNGRYGRSSGQNDFVSIGTFASFWTSDVKGNNGVHFFYNLNAKIYRADVQGNDQMYSCRCVKNY